MSYQATYTLSTDTTMQQRITSACCDVANGILTEDPATPNHTQRLNWAKYCLSLPNGVMQQALWYVIQDSAVNAAGTAATDAQLKTAVNNALPNIIGNAPSSTMGMAIPLAPPPSAPSSQTVKIPAAAPSGQ